MRQLIALRQVQDDLRDRRVVAVVGPTGSGKTKLAVKLAKTFNGVIVSADSRQVYRGLDVGTNKEGVAGKWQGLPARILDGIPQLLVDAVNPGERFTLKDWLDQARHALRHLFEAGKLPIIVGGTGLYVTALLEGYQPGGGRGAKNNAPVNFKSLILMPNIEREILNKKSDERVRRIFDHLVLETKHLLTAGVTAKWLDAIGLDYRYALKGINGSLGEEAAIEQFQAASRAYIRRQQTWWRHHGKPETIKNQRGATLSVKKFLT